MHRIRPFWKPIVALAAVFVAFFVTLAWPDPHGLDIDGSPRARAARNRDPYDLTQLKVLNRALLEVNDHYVDRDRVKPQRMLLAALNAIQRSVAPVLVHYEEGRGTVTVQVNEAKRTFKVSDLDAPWKLGGRFERIFAFLQTNLEDEDVELRDVEYATVNGMLRTLDPHTVLLTPSVFEEMQMSTRGEFGGLGIVISIREGHLTIIRPMPNTPASQAGLKRGDRIVKIEDESTLNMPLSEAVERLRGAPGSPVTVWVRRRKGKSKNWSANRRVQLVRAVIHIDSVKSRMLGEGIGYIRIANFQGNTFDDMRAALDELHRKGLKGLVLDLRDDPGGLLDQAKRVADAFLPSGTIVTTSSRDPRQRKEEFARRQGTEPNYPMVVLVNGGSASASEIVAGALKNHDRALVVGQRTFGKGSVQVIYNFNDGSALKLTIAQYLTPGDVSIQGVGVSPDIAIDPMTVDREDMDLAVNEAHLREADLGAHLTHNSARDAIDDATVLRYYLPSDRRRRLREAPPEDTENEEEDEFLTRFSRKLLLKARRPNRRDMLKDAAPVLKDVGDEQLGRAQAALRKLGVDWSVGRDRGPSTVEVRASTNRPKHAAKAGEPFELRVRVTNRGSAPLYQLRATTKSDFRLFSGRELVFGRLEAGQSRTWTANMGICETKQDKRECMVPRDTSDRADGIRIKFAEAHGHAPPEAEVRTTVRALERPQFAYALQVADDLRGNGDGKVQAGERAAMYLLVRNVGRGRTYETQANLRNLTGAGVLLQDGRFNIDGMNPGEERLVRFTFEVMPDFAADEAKFEVSVTDVDLRESANETVLVPIESRAAAPKARKGAMVLKAGATLREGPSRAAQALAKADGDVALQAEASQGGYVRVKLPSGRPAWARAADLRQGATASGKLEHLLNHEPPRLKVDFGKDLVTRQDHIKLTGMAEDESRVRDLYVFVGARKVFYQSNRGRADPKRARFKADVPLQPGMNYVTVFARESDDVVSRRLYVIRRDGPKGELLETPRIDSEIFGVSVENL